MYKFTSNGKHKMFQHVVPVKKLREGTRRKSRVTTSVIISDNYKQSYITFTYLLPAVQPLLFVAFQRNTAVTSFGLVLINSGFGFRCRAYGV